MIALSKCSAIALQVKLCLYSDDEGEDAYAWWLYKATKTITTVHKYFLRLKQRLQRMKLYYDGTPLMVCSSQGSTNMEKQFT